MSKTYRSEFVTEEQLREKKMKKKKRSYKRDRNPAVKALKVELESTDKEVPHVV